MAARFFSKLVTLQARISALMTVAVLATALIWTVPFVSTATWRGGASWKPVVSFRPSFRSAACNPVWKTFRFITLVESWIC